MKYIVYVVVIIVIVGALTFVMNSDSSTGRVDLAHMLTDTNMKIASAAFDQKGTIPERFTCDGASVVPPLSFVGFPSKAKSLALIMTDPDTARGTFDHWVVFNIPSTTAGVEEGGVLAGTYGANGAGKAAYAGPCPPDRAHRYLFDLYALDTTLTLSPGAKKDEVLSAMQGHVLATAGLMGLYERKKK